MRSSSLTYYIYCIFILQVSICVCILQQLAGLGPQIVVMCFSISVIINNVLARCAVVLILDAASVVIALGRSFLASH